MSSIGFGIGLLVLAAASALRAAPGDVLFSDDFEAGFANWTTTEAQFSGVNAMTAASASNSLFLRHAKVWTTSAPIDARVPSLRVQAWIRRGDDSFSENPEKNEDLQIEYVDANGAWIPLTIHLGSGRQGEVILLDEMITGDGLHGGFQIRFHLTKGSGGAPANKGLGWDYWHIDDVRVSEASPPPGLQLGACEEFESGLASWSVSATHGQAVIGTQTASTAPKSLALSGGTVSITSNPIALAGGSDLGLDLWIRRGDDRFSEDPDTNEDLFVEYLNDAASWVELGSYAGNGTPGQIYTPRFTLADDAAHNAFRIRLRMTGDDGPNWDFWHIDSICFAGMSGIADWRFEESRWNGTPGEVADSSGNRRSGTARNATTALRSPAIAGEPGTCGYASFDGKKDGIDIPHHDDLNGSNARTYTAWIHPRSNDKTRHIVGKQVFSGGHDLSQMGLFASQNWLYGRAITLAGTHNVRTALPPLDHWSHIALVFDGTSLSLYVGGSRVETTTFDATTLVENGLPFAIGKRPESDQDSFHGFIDEVRIYGTPLSGPEIHAVSTETHECATAAVRFVINHDGNGVNCQPETISVSVRDLDGTVLSRYDESITLDTQTGTGSWTLVSGTGLFHDSTAGDGVASYTFSARDAGTASFALDYTHGPQTVDVDVYDGASRDDDSEGDLSFAPSAYAITQTALSNPPPLALPNTLGAQTAGQEFEIHLAAFGTSADDPECGIIESYSGARSMRFWSDPIDPSVAPLAATIDSRTIASNEARASSQAVQFSQGQAVVLARYKDVGQIAIHALDDSSATAIRGSTGSFVSRPADFTIVAVENAEGETNPESSSPTGDFFARAGAPFTVVVEARDAEGSRTPSYGLEAVPEGIRLRSAELVAPIGGRNGSLDDGAIENADSFSATTPAGRFTGTTFAYDEVGAIRLEASVADADYLGAGGVTGTASSVVGRFAPSRFEITQNVPRFRTACGIGAFTWMGQPFRYAIDEEARLTVRAVNAAGATTANYAGDWWRLTHDSLDNRAYTVGGASIDESGLPGTDSDPEIVSNGDGTGTLRFSTGTGLIFARAVPRAPFDAEIQLSIDVLDEDDTAYALNPFVVGGTSLGMGIAFDISKRFQFGRLRIENAHGSELVDLPMSLRTQSFDGDVFVDDGNDSCSQIDEASLAFTREPAALSARPSIGNKPLLAGDGSLVLAAPNLDGTVDIVIDLGSSGADLPWLRYDWPEDGNLDGLFDDDPRARATFGIWEGRDQLIFVREMY